VNRLLNIFVAILLLALLLGYMVTYTVRFNESAVVTTFGAAGEGSVKNPPGSDGRGAGLHFKMPWPIQQVAARFDNRVHVLEGSIEQATTADQQSVVVRTAVYWRIEDPLAFYTSLGSVENAERQVRVRLRNAVGLVGNYRFGDLANLGGGGAALEELAENLAQEVRNGLDPAVYGMAIERALVTKVEPPGGPVTQAIFQRMAAERDALAAQARNEGEAEFARVVNQAENEARTIESFVDRQARRRESVGERRAAEVLAELEGPARELALYLDQLDALSDVFASRTRFIIDTDRFPFRLLDEYLTSGEEASPGE
jgi:membrane protease subunit HflC